MRLNVSELITRPESRVQVKKGWGFEDWIYNGDAYCGKLLSFEKGKRCSFHYHEVKDEVLYLHSGKVVMKFSEGDDLAAAKSVTLTPGMAFHIPRRLRHQMIAEKASLIFEFSTHHEDADSYRVVRGD
jgi:mannose-6-phosphate isomerase-like protein (cupin superfamily)